MTRKRRMKAGQVGALLAVFGVLAAEPAWAGPPTAYRQVAEHYGVPPQVLYAVAQTESNTQLRIGYYPWPWTLNVKGKPMRFETRELACQAVLKAIAEQGIYAVDIGLTQQNWGYVGRARFREPCDALHPINNLQSAALLLRQYYKQTGDWVSAAGMYHRPAGGEPARLYRSKIQERLNRMVAER
jgi:soluble lytic murein transglycosylase-like protein